MRKSIPLATLLLLSACQQKHLSHYEPVPEEGWERGRSICLPASADGEEWRTLHVRATTDFPFTNLALELRHDSVCDTVRLSISAHRDARILQSSAPLPRPISTPTEVRQIMDEELLSGILDIGME